MRFHVLGLCHTVTNKDYIACAFTQKVVKFCEMMMPKSEEEILLKKQLTDDEIIKHKTIHKLIHYGHERSNVEVDELVTVMTDEIMIKTYGQYNWKKQFFKNNANDLCHTTFTMNTITEIGKRYKVGDIILCFWGLGHKHIGDFFKNCCIIVEPGIGYMVESSSDAPFKVFESYAIMHTHYATKKITQPPFYDCVIPNYFNKDDFEFRVEKDNYFLFIGRIISTKGIHIMIQLAKSMGFRLVIAGQGSLDDIGEKQLPSNIEYIGYVDLDKRKKLLAGAKALLLPTIYVEPFGGVTIEAMLSGTPVITTDWGAFPETVLHGITGYRCRTMDHFRWAIRNINNIDPFACRDWALKNYSLERCRLMYEEYFDMLLNVRFGNGFYYEDDDRIQLDWLKHEYPLIRSESEYKPIKRKESQYLLKQNGHLVGLVKQYKST